MFTKRVLLLLLAAILVLQTIFITTVPHKVAASSTLSIGDNNQVELTVNARWVNRATINFEIQNIKVNDTSALTGDAQNLYNNTGNDTGLLAAVSVNNGDFKDGDLLDTPGFSGNSGLYGKNYCGGNIELISVPNMSFNTGGDTPQLKLSDLRVDTGNGNCIGLLSARFAIVRLNMDVSDALPNRDIWFDYINADSITRVDNGEKFVRKDTTNADKYQLDTASNTDSCIPKVLIGESERTNGQHLMKGNFETCIGDRKNFDVQVYRENIDTGSSNTITPENTAANQPTCESNNTAALAWLLCGVLDVVDKAVTGLGDAAIQLLDSSAPYYDNPQLKSVWSYFKNISSFLLIIIGLVMIIGQAVNKE